MQTTEAVEYRHQISVGGSKMILADKIIEERKKLGLSQEELAEKLSVSRQAVSKWESAQSIPELQKIILMSELFSVSTDYLLKDELEPEQHTQKGSDADRVIRRVSISEANEFLDYMKAKSKAIALGVLLCILSPVLLILLGGLADENIGNISESLAVAVGMSALLILIAVAVTIFIRIGAKGERFEYLSKEVFETEYGVSGLVKELNANYMPTYSAFLCIGIALCILSPLPLILCALFYESETLAIAFTALLLCIVAAGVYMIVRGAIVKSSFMMLLQEGEYRKNNKKSSKTVNAVSSIYWGLVTAIYLGWSFITRDWEHSWIVWPVAGVLCAPVMMIAKLCDEKRRDNL